MRETTSEGVRVAREMSRLLNNMGPQERVVFIAEMARDHRTLQQAFTRLCVDWFNDLSRRESFDLRNQASVELAKKLKPVLDTHPLPYV